MSNTYNKLKQYLIVLQQELQELSLWQTHQPKAEALMSQAPFCCDTLTFEQWLQFVLIEKLQTYCTHQLKLPSNICICPMAEEAFAWLKGKEAILINIIADIDELLSGNRVQTKFKASR